MTRINFACCHLYDTITSRGMRKYSEKLVSQLKPIADTFDSIAFCGLSGAIIAPIVALQLDKDIIAVRKNETRCSILKVEGHKRSRYVIIDDMIDSGHTINNIESKINKWCKRSKLVGVALYQDDGFMIHESEGYQEFFKNRPNVWLIHAGIQKPVNFFEMMKENKNEEVESIEEFAEL